jgi:hypothetical protein
LWATPTIAGPSGRARIHRGARDIDPDKVYGSKGQSDGDPGQLYGRASLRHPKNANEKKESADQLEDKGRDSVVFAPCDLTQRTIPA